MPLFLSLGCSLSGRRAKPLPQPDRGQRDQRVISCEERSDWRPGARLAYRPSECVRWPEPSANADGTEARALTWENPDMWSQNSEPNWRRIPR